jgi:hypothetical protein
MIWVADATLVVASDTAELHSVPLGPTDGDVGGRRCDFCGVVGWEALLACGVEDLAGNAGCKGERGTWGVS